MNGIRKLFKEVLIELTQSQNSIETNYIVEDFLPSKLAIDWVKPKISLWE